MKYNIKYEHITVILISLSLSFIDLFMLENFLMFSMLMTLVYFYHIKTYIL